MNKKKLAIISIIVIIVSVPIIISAVIHDFNLIINDTSEMCGGNKVYIYFAIIIAVYCIINFSLKKLLREKVTYMQYRLIMFAVLLTLTIIYFAICSIMR